MKDEKILTAEEYWQVWRVEKSYPHNSSLSNRTTNAFAEAYATYKYKALVKELLVLYNFFQPENCPEWVEGVGDCKKPDCTFCKIESYHQHRLKEDAKSEMAVKLCEMETPKPIADIEERAKEFYSSDDNKWIWADRSKNDLISMSIKFHQSIVNEYADKKGEK